jgi:hypothetical protein
VGLLIRHADHVDEEQLGQPVLAHDGDRVRPAKIGELQMAIALHGDEPVTLHPVDGLAHCGAALVESLGDPGAQWRDTLFLELEDRAQVHLGGVDQIVHVGSSCALMVPVE